MRKPGAQVGQVQKPGAQVGQGAGSTGIVQLCQGPATRSLEHGGGGGMGSSPCPSPGPGPPPRRTLPDTDLAPGWKPVPAAWGLWWKEGKWQLLRKPLPSTPEPLGPDPGVLASTFR